MRKNKIESKIEMILEFSEKNIAEKIFKAISPDNKPLPEGLKIESWVDNNKIFFYIECKRGLSSLLFTIDDLLSSLQLSSRLFIFLKNISFFR
ncbi:MAG: KEOPS complex subunit Pcc1 [Nitrososphaerota archaeon]